MKYPRTLPLVAPLATLIAGLIAPTAAAPAGTSETFSIDTRGLGAPPNDACLLATDLCPGIAREVDLTLATPEGGSTCGTTEGARDAWFRYAPATSGPAHLFLCGSDFDSVVSVHSDCPGTAANEIACNDDSTGPNCAGVSGPSELEFAAQAERVYLVRVAGFQGAAGRAVVEIEGPVCAGALAPEIVVDPEALVFTIAAGGTTPTPTPSPTPTPVFPVNDACASALEVCIGLPRNGTLAGATEDGASTCLSNEPTGDVWYVYRPAANGTATFSTCGSPSDTIVSLHSGCPGAAANELACNDDTAEPDCGRGSTVSIEVIAGAEVFVRVAAYDRAAMGDFSLRVSGPGCGAGTGRNLYVEIDSMVDATHDHRPSQAVVDAAVATFASAGWTLVVDLDDSIPFQEVLNIVPGGPSVSPDIQDIAAAHFDHAADPLYRYCIFGHSYSYNGGPTGSSGHSDLPGRFFIVTLGGFANGTGSFSNQVGTFMHELGHALGQTHGGEDHSNYKPNYVGVMNYLYQLGGVNSSLIAYGFANEPSFEEFGYSRGTLPPLNESALDERLGIGLGRAIDWNCDLHVDGTLVVKDVGGYARQSADFCLDDVVLEVLTDFDNWTDIENHAGGAGGGAGARGVPSNKPALGTPAEICIGPKEYARLRQWGLGRRREIAAARRSAGRSERDSDASAGALDGLTGITSRRAFTIRNEGTAPLAIASLAPQSPAEWLDIAPTGPFSIAVGESITVEVTLDHDLAPPGNSGMRVVIRSDDSDEDPYPTGVDVTIERSAVRRDALDHLLGRTPGGAELDANADGALDAGDVPIR